MRTSFMLVPFLPYLICNNLLDLLSQYLFAALPDIQPVFKNAVFKEQQLLVSAFADEIYASFQQVQLFSGAKSKTYKFF